VTTLERPRTVGELRASGYRVLPVREEMRKNLIAKIRTGEPLFPGIYGYDDTVIPHVVNAILAGQDIIFLGERGQAKSRIIRSLVSLLDDEIPILAGCEIPEDPFNPITQAGRDIIAQKGDDAELEWLPRDKRYGEKLATPDITIADLIGEIDPIKVAEGRYLSDELTIHYGLIPHCNRGIFAINELPDLAERIQVGLLNILEERDVQIRGFHVRLPLDLFVVASANPEDYTSRGRIITPLKDRLGSQIRTHYPRTIEDELAIVRQEKVRFPPEPGIPAVVSPRFMEEIVAELTHLARRSPEVSQRSGVSVRVSVANLEVLEAAALKRAVRLGEPVGVPRVSDLPALVPATVGKLELETLGDDVPEERLVERLVARAVLAVFNRFCSLDDAAPVVEAFEDGLVVETGDRRPAGEYVRWLREIPGLEAAVRRLGALDGRPVPEGSVPAADRAGFEAALVASAVELVLEGLHLQRRLNKDRLADAVVYRR